jgi:hypothetical protein
MNETKTVTKFEVRITEKAEHWTFDYEVIAKDETEARSILSKVFPKKAFIIGPLYPAHGA